MLIAFVHTDNLRRFMPYVAVPERARIIESHNIRCAGPVTHEACEYETLLLRRNTETDLKNIIGLSKTDDVLLIGGTRLLRLAYPYTNRMYWLRSAVDDSTALLWPSFDLHDWYVDKVDRTENGVLTLLNRRGF